MKTVAIIQARMGSSRLPGKVMEDLGGRPVLGWVTRAARIIPGVDEVVVATSTNDGDDAVAGWCADNGVTCYRGSEDDVLSRFAGVAKDAKADTVMRLTADCPLLDPQVAGTVLALFQATKADYASNVSPANWPDGLDCEVFTAKALAEADAQAALLIEREHVTPFIHYNRHRYEVRTLSCPLPRLAGDRWTLDNPEDLEFLRKVAAHLADDRPPSYLEILDVLEQNPDYRKINCAIDRNEGLLKTLTEEPPVPSKGYGASRKLLDRALKAIPVGSQTFSKSYLQYPENAPMFLTYGDGGCVWDVDGNSYVDFVMGLLPNVLGYRDPDVDAAISHQLGNGITFSLATELEVNLAEKLIEIIPTAEMVRFGKDGSDATSAAIRLSRAFTGRERIMASGYHGWQDWYIGATTRDKGVPEAVRGLTHMVPYNNLDGVAELLDAHPGEYAAMIMEPTNIAEPAPGYFADLKSLLQDHSVLLVFDEIITGFRFALGGAQELYGAAPDLSCFGKSMGNGMPISAVVGRADIMSEMEEIFFSGTFSGETLSIAASLAVIEKMKREPVIQTLWEKGGALAKKAEGLIKEHGLEDTISFVGAAPWKLLSFQNHNAANAKLIRSVFIQEMLRQGVLLTASHNISYAHNDENIATALAAYNHVLPLIHRGLEAGTLENQLAGPVIEPVFAVR
ncbi:MAG: aminotransferase class III-fold pyridoxal phosphate-dependent enzyme [Rhodospirillaceae bacterium]|nr:aminotransferase class III-fold pyridoxal phosphate-dependent enzyme [Rhodospirillaceae bacterium]